MTNSRLEYEAEVDDMKYDTPQVGRLAECFCI